MCRISGRKERLRDLVRAFGDDGADVYISLLGSILSGWEKPGFDIWMARILWSRQHFNM